MAYAVQLTMGTTWHGKEEEFSNIFHYDAPPLTTEAGWEELGYNVWQGVRMLFAPDVKLKRIRVHGPTHLTKVEDVMVSVKDYTLEAGGLATYTRIAPELAIVADVYVGRGPKGGKQFLRKYLHTCGIGETASDAGVPEGRLALAGASKTPVVNALNALKTVSVGGSPNDICTPQGKHLPVGSTWVVNDYLHTRQFKRGRKERITP